MIKSLHIRRILFAVIMIISCQGFLYAMDLNMSGVIAYPVPFNPDKKALTIKGTGISTYTTDINICDINGDIVLSRTLSNLSSDYNWSGYNSRGKKVKPGMYIIRIRMEDTTNGAHGEKIIRILVNY